VTVDRLMHALEIAEQSGDPAVRMLADAARRSLESGRPVLSRSEYRAWNIEQRRRHLQAAHRHAQGETVEARMRTLQGEIARMHNGDLASLGVETATESRMRASIRAAEKHGAIVLGDRAMREILAWKPTSETTSKTCAPAPAIVSASTTETAP